MLFSKSILLEEADAYVLTVGQTVTLVDIGNAVVESIQKAEHSVRTVEKIGQFFYCIQAAVSLTCSQITSVALKLDLTNTNFTNTLKFTWVAAPQGTVAPVDITMIEYDYLITKAGVPKVLLFCIHDSTHYSLSFVIK